MNFKLSFFLTVLIFLASCSGGESQLLVGSDYTGTTGVNFQFSTERPPDRVFMNRPFLVGFDLANQGGFDLKQGDYGVITVNYNQLYFDEEEDMTDGDGLLDNLFGGSSREGLADTFRIPGVSPALPSGGIDYMSLGTLRPKLPSGRTEVQTTLRASVCYPYVTRFSDLTCIDQDFFNDGSGGVCTSSTTRYRSQGAPVAITRIEPLMTPIGTVESQSETTVATFDEDGVFSGVEREVVDTEHYIIQPGFEIFIEQVGEGTIFYTGNTPNDACSQTDDRQINVVRIFANLNVEGLECEPEYIKLERGKGSTRCFLPEDNIRATSEKYMDLLNIDLDYYHYIEREKRIKIES